MSNHRQQDDDDMEETLDPPKFRLPDHFDSDRFEVWTLRLPRDLNLADLNGARLALGHQRNEEAVDFTSRKGNKKFTLQWGDARESECFRMILPRPNDSDSDDSDDDDGTFLYPADIPFVRHASILPAIQHKTQFELAPSMENAPPPADDVVRHSYAPVPQKQGLKRRWTPLGGNTTVATSLPLKRKMKNQENHTDGHAKHRTIKCENSEDVSPPSPPTNNNNNSSSSNSGRIIMKDDPDASMADRIKIKKNEPDTPSSDRKKVKKEKKKKKRKSES